MAYGMIPKKERSAMADGLGFYSDLTEIAEGRITELITHAEAAERRADAFLPQAGAYYRACALTVFMAWRDVTKAGRRCMTVSALPGCPAHRTCSPRRAQPCSR